ncbi:GalNAc(5)-diNAcBac-PP-undecaprenol beta-1,3-glucosyltransferase [Roseimaritima multifibrata]|uniref:GalNAc(5)-diNAcBac-PP-undecaprenol beta-1,3-glucosyltransferase n=1 Tax=Roseimaritima multifibrata TaxID=1930274 RepID=A0A517MNI4_9BACT|nr:glycosyltransferase family A protein [Roseimaritima multifibrata]QDS96347.1 GalNAc(5)-diNAcBac-PP-undecaprenol beta-1,3-glucosyltransferase [Roseimaritima multifibrata]
MRSAKFDYAVVVPAYNRELVLPRALQSVFAQPHVPSEVVVVDDGSDDQTAEVARQFSSKIKVLRIENSGPAAARKLGIEATSAEWVCPLDSDDEWDLSFIETLQQLRNRFTSAGLLFSNFRICREGGSIELADKLMGAPASWRAYLTDDGFAINLGMDAYLPLLEFSPVFQSCMAFKRTVYEEIGGIDDRVARMPAEDAHLTKRLASRTQVVGAAETKVTIYRDGNNFSANYPRVAYGDWWILRDLFLRNFVPARFLEPTRKECERRAAALLHSLFEIRDFESMLDVLPYVQAGDWDWKLRTKVLLAKAWKLGQRKS